jgi:hypothetical protein
MWILRQIHNKVGGWPIKMGSLGVSEMGRNTKEDRRFV